MDELHIRTTPPKLTIVVARSSNFVIGNANELPWSIPEDLAHFKRVTMGKPIIMGRRTFESIGRPLPGRFNVVISRNPELKIEGVAVFESLEKALKFFAGTEEVCLIGGGQLYQEGLKYATKMLITEMNFPVIGDTYFMFDKTDWALTNQSPDISQYASFYFHTYERITPPATY